MKIRVVFGLECGECAGALSGAEVGDVVRYHGDAVREGWKSGDPSKLDDHIADMGEVFSESRRICRSGGVLALVTSNSTLGDLEFPVIDRLAHEADHHGWTVLKHLERTAHFGSATYHRSARTDKVIQRDHVLVFKAG